MRKGVFRLLKCVFGQATKDAQKKKIVDNSYWLEFIKNQQRLQVTVLYKFQICLFLANMSWINICFLFFFPQDAASSSSPPEKGKDERSKPNKTPEENKKWAIPVDISSPCDDFYKRIPNPAFKVNIVGLFQRLAFPSINIHSWRALQQCS